MGHGPGDCFYPVHKRLARRIKRHGLSALISCLLVILGPVVLAIALGLLQAFDKQNDEARIGARQSSVAH